VLDIDDVGLGDPILDVATYTAHLSAMVESHPESSERLLAHQHAIRTAYLERSGVEEAALAAREAVVGLGLATGPLRVLSDNWPARVDERIAIAARFFGAAVR
jgi:aminoglycoside phosphotransferase (APT) family kinase protein